MRRCILLFLVFLLSQRMYSQNTALEYYRNAEAHFQNENYIQALRDLDNAMALKPEYSWACYKLKARIRSRLEDHVAAVYDYNRALELNPSDAESYLNRGIEKRKFGDEPGAIADFNKALELKPGYAEAYFERGIALGLQGRRKESCEDWQKSSETGYEKAAEYLKTFCQ